MDTAIINIVEIGFLMALSWSVVLGGSAFIYLLLRDEILKKLKIKRWQIVLFWSLVVFSLIGFSCLYFLEANENGLWIGEKELAIPALLLWPGYFWNAGLLIFVLFGLLELETELAGFSLVFSGTGLFLNLITGLFVAMGNNLGVYFFLAWIFLAALISHLLLITAKRKFIKAKILDLSEDK